MDCRQRFLRAALSFGSALGLTALALSGAQAGLLETPSSEPQILPVEQALVLQPASWQAGTLTLRWDLAPGVYLYRDRLRFEVIEPAGYALGAVQLAAGETHHDEHFGDVRVFRGHAEARFSPAAARPPQKLKVRYQGCAENLVCYPPQTRDIDVLTFN